ncbi:MAG TPA: DEAD/DEAH box helicase [Gaiellaceae bacterium]|jgi:superfamily II DNA/RNA helicase
MKQSFAALGVSASVVEALSRRDIRSPFAIQALVLPDALAGIDVLAASPTGSGKTLAFGIPMIERVAGAGGQPSALVLVPTRELASQIVEELQPLAKARKLRIAAIYGGTSVTGQASRARGADILVATPGRLQDLLERKLVSLDAVRVLVLDEADRMLDMGFRPAVDQILKRIPQNRQTLLFSATLEGQVADLARTYTNNASRFTTGSQIENAPGDVDHEFVAVTADDKLEQLAEQLQRERGLALVFVRTKYGADKLARKLVRVHDMRANVLHGNMSQNARERSLAQFESGRVSTLIATDIAARGLDVDDITHVINFDPPRTPDDYVHRIGRTGRAGRTGTGVTLVLPEQQSEVSRLAKTLGHDNAFAASGIKAPPAAPKAPRRRRR